MKKCDCYEEMEITVPRHCIIKRCNGTKEQDHCSCGGDQAKCDFYPEVRKKAKILHKEQKKMQWYVWRYNVNSQIIDKYNVFEHRSFCNDIRELLELDLNIDDFAEELKNAVQYYFWAKCEHEIVITGWPTSHSDVDLKVDIYDQIRLNWDIFVKYVWSYREDII
jgi:hypothetical protein